MLQLRYHDLPLRGSNASKTGMADRRYRRSERTQLYFPRGGTCAANGSPERHCGAYRSCRVSVPVGKSFRWRARRGPSSVIGLGGRARHRPASEVVSWGAEVPLSVGNGCCQNLAPDRSVSPCDELDRLRRRPSSNWAALLRTACRPTPSAAAASRWDRPSMYSAR